MSNRLKYWLIAALLFVAMGIVGHFDAEEAERQADEYCYNVKTGLWPDYQGTFKRDCRDVQK